MPVAEGLCVLTGNTASVADGLCVLQVTASVAEGLCVLTGNSAEAITISHLLEVPERCQGYLTWVVRR